MVDLPPSVPPNHRGEGFAKLLSFAALRHISRESVSLFSLT